MVVGKNAPNHAAALSIHGALRIQENTAKNNQLVTCTSNLAGTVKSVKAVYNAGQTNANQLCPCLCDGTKWEPLITTPQCINACEGKDQTDINKDLPKC
jgi:hypothetical protein